MMNKELLNALKNINEEELEKVVNTDLKKAWIGSFFNDSMLSGCNYRLMLADDGEIFLTDPMQQGSFSQAEYDGERICLYEMDAWADDDDEYIQDFNVIDLLNNYGDEEDKENLLNYLIEEYGELEEKENTIQNYIDEYDIDWNCIFVNTLHHIYDIEKRDNLEIEWDDKIKDCILQEIENNINELIEHN